ncbi:MAG: hypothetical protein M9944_03515 [Rhizobiaceae bacterium]|nr:hypothetical protein [Rhizobiaceae bacterium]
MVPVEKLCLFYDLLKVDKTDQALYAIAESVSNFVNKYHIARKLISRCISTADLNADWKSSIFTRLNRIDLLEDDSLLWLQDLYEHNKPAADPGYEMFLQKHAKCLVSLNQASIFSYLLYPERGPGNLQIDAYEVAIDHVDEPAPLINRWINWIHKGYFNGAPSAINESPSVLYKKIEYAAKRSSHRYDAIRQAAHKYVLMQFNREENVRFGLYHLITMVDIQYAFAADVRTDVLDKIESYRLPGRSHLICTTVKEAFSALTRLQANPSEQREREYLTCYRWLRLEDDVSGYWTDSLEARRRIDKDFFSQVFDPRFDGVILSLEWKDALWDKFVTAVPRPRTLSEQQYSDRKLRSRS